MPWLKAKSHAFISYKRINYEKVSDVLKTGLANRKFFCTECWKSSSMFTKVKLKFQDHFSFN